MQLYKKPYLWSALRHVALLAIFLVWNPFDIASIGERESRDLFLEFIAPFYPHQFQDEIVIITINNSDLKNLTNKAHWPPPYKLYDDILKVVASWQPRGVLFNIFLSDQREKESTHELQKTLHDWYLSAKNPPLIMGTYLSETLDESQNGNTNNSIRIERLHPEIDPYIPIESRALIRWARQDDNFMLANTPGKTTYFTAASALYLSDLKRKDLEFYEKFQSQLISKKNPGMTVIWGAGLPSAAIKNEFCRPIEGKDNAWKSIKQLWFIFLSKLIRPGLPDKPMQRFFQDIRCPYHVEISATELLQWPLYQPEQRFNLLEGKFIIIGAHLDGFSDYQTNKNIPGSFIHAMALDNLLTLNNRYFRMPETNNFTLYGQQFSWSWSIFIELACAFLILALIKHNHCYQNPECSLHLVTNTYKWLNQILLALLIIITFLFIFTFVMRYTPINWLSILFFASGELLPDSRIRTKTAALIYKKSRFVYYTLPSIIILLTVFTPTIIILVFTLTLALTGILRLVIFIKELPNKTQPQPNRQGCNHD